MTQPSPTDRPDAHCPDCPFSDRGDWVMYRDEWDNLQQELRIARFDAEVPARELRESERARVIARLVEMADVLDQDAVARTAETLRRAAAVLEIEGGQ